MTSPHHKDSLSTGFIIPGALPLTHSTFEGRKKVNLTSPKRPSIHIASAPSPRLHITGEHHYVTNNPNSIYSSTTKSQYHQSSDSRRLSSQPVEQIREKNRADSIDLASYEQDDDETLVKETDLEEQFIRGSGSGGQKINKSSVCVVLKHIPTGITVRCQESRSQLKNRELARKLLESKLDEVSKGKDSQVAREASKAKARKAKRRRRSVSKHHKSKQDRLLLED